MSDRVQIGGGVLSNRGLEAAMKAHRDSVSPTNRQMIAEAIVAYQRNAIDLTSEGEAAELCEDEGCPHYGTPHVCNPTPQPAPAELEVVATAVHPGSFGRWEVRPEEGATIASGDKFVRLTDAQAAIAAKDGEIERLRGAGKLALKSSGRSLKRAEAAEARAEALEKERDALREDAALLDALRDESWDLRCFTIPDADIGWRVIGHWMAEPQERVVAEVYTDDPRAAIRAALHPEKEGE